MSAGAIVIRNDGRILAVQRMDTGAWVTPGGVVEPHESIRDAAVREVYEETGIRVDLGPLVGIYQNLSTDVVSFMFSARAADDAATRASEETTHVRWLTLREAAELMSQAFATRVRDAFEQPAPAVLRTVSEPHIMDAKHVS